ncbi:MAG: metal-sulfur cluster assembly factor [Nanoarchaeota archaeon]
MKPLTKEDAINAIRGIVDPELGIDLWRLGLIYGLDLEGNRLKVKMTFTSPACPYAPMLVEALTTDLKRVGFSPEFDFVFDPPWKPSEDLRMELGLP